MQSSIIILLLSLLIFPCWAEGKVDAPTEIDETGAFIVAQRNLKPFGLAHCISRFHRGDTIPKDIELSKSTYFEGASLDYKAFNELREYVEKVIPENMLYTPLDMEPMYFLSCVDMYESEEYVRVVNGLVRKYLPQ